MKTYLIRLWNQVTRRKLERWLRDFMTPERFNIPPEMETKLLSRIRVLRPHHFPILEAFAYEMAHHVLDTLFGTSDDTRLP